MFVAQVKKNYLIIYNILDEGNKPNNYISIL